ncbi:MAG: rod-binding protein [Pirellulales bacterium]|nr:rod-binding protein [Pirellulales bacterium]
MRIGDFSRGALDAVPRGPFPQPPETNGRSDEETRRAFQSFAGQTLFGQMLEAMRKTVGKPAYFHGGQAEEIFRNQLDQVLAEKLSDAASQQFSEPMYELFTLSRR